MWGAGRVLETSNTINGEKGGSLKPLKRIRREINNEEKINSIG